MPRVVEPYRRRARAALLRGLTRSAGAAPSALLHGSLRALAAAAGRSRFADVARENLRAAWPRLADELPGPERLERTARAVMRHSARVFAEWLRLARSTPPLDGAADRGRWIDDKVVLDPSITILDEQLATGRGALIVTAHLGNWELLCAALRRRGLGGAVVGRVRPRDSTFDWLVEMRRAYGVETIPQDAPPQRLLRVLRDGGTVGLLADLEVRRLDGEFLPFLGRPALTMTAPAALARAHGIPLLPVRCTALDADWEGRYELVVDPPLELDRGLDRREATVELSARLNGVYERWIRATPEQWAWHQRRWRTRPGEHQPVPLAERQRRAGRTATEGG